jgi:hypothetical protein
VALRMVRHDNINERAGEGVIGLPCHFIHLIGQVNVNSRKSM